MRTATILLLALALCTGCATQGYLGDRARDAADIFTASAGKGVGVKAHVLPLYLTAFHGWNRVMKNTDVGGRLFGPLQGDLYYYNISGLGLMEDGWKYGIRADFSMNANDWRRVTQIGVAVGIGPAVGVGANLAEALDFLLGLATVDIFGDDGRDRFDFRIKDPTVNPAVSMKPAVDASRTLMDKLLN